MTDPIWILMPILGAREYTRAAISDGLAQTVPTRLLLINQGVDEDFREELEAITEAHQDRIFLWSHVPALPSLSATWNRGLDFCWATGAKEALVVNNDVRLHSQTVERLTGVLGHTPAHFVSAVGVTAEQFGALGDQLPDELLTPPDADGWGHPIAPGGPDFSCFLISREGHAAYRFDEGFVPAYCEDLDLHRRFLLDGNGHRIFSINLPYLHHASGTLKTASEEKRLAIAKAVDRGSRAHYRKKWGGNVNEERYRIPFDPESAEDGITTPELQRKG